MKQVAITGTSGTLGSAVKERFQKAGFKVIELNRNPKTQNEIAFVLGKTQSVELPSNTLALIHCAHDFSVRTMHEQREINKAGSKVLFRAAKASGAKIVFVSTISAFDGCQSTYGKVKLEIEKECVEMGGVVIRPGLLYSEKLKGMFGTLVRLTQKISSFPLRILPVFDGGRQPFYLAHIEDVAECIYKMATLDYEMLRAASKESFVFTVANPKAFPFKDLLSVLTGKSVFFLSFPSKLALWGLRALERIGLSLPITADNLLGMIHFPMEIDWSRMDEIGVHCRPFGGPFS